MSDLIERQAAIDAIEQMQIPIMRSVFPEEQFVFTGMSEALRAIKELPSVPPQKVCVAEVKVEIDDIKDYIDKAINAERWIPCERELPEVGRSVLISVGGMYTAEGCLREDGDWSQFRWDTIQRKDMVGAWKPLEEPYNGGQE